MVESTARGVKRHVKRCRKSKPSLDGGPVGGRALSIGRQSFEHIYHSHYSPRCWMHQYLRGYTVAGIVLQRRFLSKSMHS